MKLRAEQGAYTGAIQIDSFTLPNPGGGANLIDEGEFTLMNLDGNGKDYYVIYSPF